MSPLIKMSIEVVLYVIGVLSVSFGLTWWVVKTAIYAARSMGVDI